MNAVQRISYFARGFLAGSAIEIAYALYVLNNTPFLRAYCSGEGYIFIFMLPAMAAAAILFEEVIISEQRHR
ncbi:MAG: hypothetical protein ACXQS5_03875 [Candidatus Methanospirareceae archaeon]